MTDDSKPVGTFTEQTLSDMAQVLDQPNPPPENVTRLVEMLVSALAEPNEKLRYDAAIMLGKIPDIRAVEPLIQVAVGDSEAMVQVEAVGALSNMAAMLPAAHERVVDTLIELPGKSPRTLVRRKAVQGMTLLKPVRAVPALEASILDMDRPLKALIAEALKAIDTPEARTLIQKRNRSGYEGR